MPQQMKAESGECLYICVLVGVIHRSRAFRGLLYVKAAWKVLFSYSFPETRRQTLASLVLS